MTSRNFFNTVCLPMKLTKQAKNMFMNMNKIVCLDCQRWFRHDGGETGTAAKHKERVVGTLDAVSGMQNRGGQEVLLPDFLLFFATSSTHLKQFHFGQITSCQACGLRPELTHLAFMLFESSSSHEPITRNCLFNSSSLQFFNTIHSKTVNIDST